MKFKELISKQSLIENAILLGMKSQKKLAPSYREGILHENSKLKKPKLAAVLALFYPNDSGKATIVLTKRATYNGTHSAQISFPGGKKEETDTSLSDTALREAFEEVGVSTDKVQVVKKMTDLYVPPSNFLITPYLAFTNKRPEFVKNHEVAKIIEVTLELLLNDDSIRHKTKTNNIGHALIIPYFQFESEEIWGATAMILNEIKELIKNL
ncbi:MAG: NUDIX hydrolase [Flavicella sp.]